MSCPRCGTDVPPVAHFCQRCGHDLRSPDLARRRSFAARPDEPVASFALISTIMPRGTGNRPQTYRIALTLALTVALVAAIFGALPIAVLVAAFAIPVVYVVYLYDVNLWKDEPIPVTALAFALTGVLATGFTIGWRMLAGPVLPTVGLGNVGLGGPTVGSFLVFALLVPIVGEAIREVGPLYLASRPRFDDLMDGLTFGVTSGVAYATFDTLVKRWDWLTGGFAGSADPGLWVSLIFLDGFVKPLIFGTATGIACAEFSGLGRGYDGFTPRYFRGLAEAIFANVAFQAGVYLFAFIPQPTTGALVTVLWGLLILVVLVLRVRNVLHAGLMEAALERTAREDGVGELGELQFCARCEMPLLAGAAFCNACGTAVQVMAAAGPRVGARQGSSSSALPVPGATTGEEAARPRTPAESVFDYTSEQPPPPEDQPPPSGANRGGRP